MSTKTYRGATLEECFTKVKSDMGRDAIILTSRMYQPILGKFGKPKHEVVATLDEAIAQAARPTSASVAAGGRGVYGYSRGNMASAVAEPADAKLRMVDIGPARAIEIAQARAAKLREIETRGLTSRRIEVRGFPESESTEATEKGRNSGESDPSDQRTARERLTIKTYAPEPRTVDQAAADDRLQRLETQLTLVTTNLQRLTDVAIARGKSAKPEASTHVKPSSIPEPTYTKLRKRLAESSIVEPLIRRIVEELPAGLTDAQSEDAARTAIAGRILIAGTLEPLPGKTTSVAFIGPSGVGKTTTLAKLAAQMTLVGHHKVAIITMDTQRVAASRQIEVFGEILRIPVKIAYDGDELAQQHEEFAELGYDFVMIDTPGKSPGDTIAISEVTRVLKRLPMVTTYLVLAAPISAANHDFVTGKFYSVASPDAVILTKCDEAVDSSHYAHLMTAQAKFSVPIAYVTSGSHVPDDIAVADAHHMADRLLAG